MASFKYKAVVLMLVMPVMGIAEPAPVDASRVPAMAPDCAIAAPVGPFAAEWRNAPEPPVADRLPTNPGAVSTLIAPALRHRWVPKTGLVESSDGSLSLYGVVQSEVHEGGFNVVVLVGYKPADEAVTHIYDGMREEVLSRASGALARVETEAGALAFDITLPAATIPEGHYGEVETLVWLDGVAIDARRWTVYAGPRPPNSLECTLSAEQLPALERRSLLSRNGELIVRAPRSATLAVVPIGAAGPGEAQFVRLEKKGLGWRAQLPKDTRLAAIWESPLAGPGPDWISSFWSARPSGQSEKFVFGIE